MKRLRVMRSLLITRKVAEENQMSIKLMTQIWDDAGALSGNRLLVMLCLADHANDEGVCWPSTQRIADRCRISRRQVLRILADLESGGWLKIEKDSGKSNRYVVNVTSDIAVSLVKNVTSDIAMSQVMPEMSQVTSDISGMTCDISGMTSDIAMSPEPSIIEPSYGTVKNRTTTIIGGSVFSTYEKNIGVLTEHIADLIKGAVEEHGESVVEDAIKTAAENNVHKWAYVDGILKRWRANGRQKPKPQPKKGDTVLVRFEDPFGVITQERITI